MIDTTVQTVVTKGVYTAECLDIARSFLKGVHSDYYFFQYSDAEYVLLVGDITFQGFSCIGNDVSIYDFVCSPVTSSQSIQIPFQGSQSGQYGGSDGAGGFQGSVNGNSTLQIQKDDLYNVTFTYLASAENVQISNSSYLVYGSSDMLPHLIEGVENYAFAAFLLAVGVLGFKLSDRIFRRVY